MRTVGHDLDLAAIQRQLDRARAAVHPDPAEQKDARARANAYFFKNLVDNGLTVARAGYLYDLGPPEIQKVLRDALFYAQEMLDIAGAVSPIEIRKYLGAALISGNVSLVKWLAQLHKDSYTLPAIEINRAGYMLVQALQAGALGERKEFDALQKEFAANISSKKLKVNPRSAQEIYEPLSGLLQSISLRDQAAFEKAWAAQAAAWKKRWSRPSEKANNNGVLDLEALGIGRIAQNFGLKVPDTNPYAPLELLANGKSQ